MNEVEKNASYWLNRAVAMEGEGKDKSADMALNRAIKIDQAEHMGSPGAASPPSLPRRAQ